MGKGKVDTAILHGFTPETLSMLITDAVVGGHFKTKGEARKRVEDLLRVFIRQGTTGKELTRKKHLFAMQRDNQSKIYWQRKVKELRPDLIDGFYKELELLLDEKGLLHIEYFNPIKGAEDDATERTDNKA